MKHTIYRFCDIIAVSEQTIIIVIKYFVTALAIAVFVNSRLDYWNSLLDSCSKVPSGQKYNVLKYS